MKREATRRAVLGAIVGAGVAGGYLSPARAYLERFSPLSGTVWESARGDRPDTVKSPYGPAELRYDDHGVPHLRAEDELALSFAVGHTQAIDRGFQLDLQRRLFSGELAAIVGELALDSDRFHRQLQFREAAEATAAHLEGSAIGEHLQAYAAGVTAGYRDGPLAPEFGLLEYQPAPWTPTDSMLTEKIIAWQLTGRFRTLRRALLRHRFGSERTEELFPARLDHDVPIIRDRHNAGPFRQGGSHRRARVGTADPVGPDVVGWLGRFEPAPGWGSNSWIIGPDHAAGDRPLLGNDPHLRLQAPPVWYEMHLDGPDHRVRGVTFPGVPFVIIGETDHAAWGFTNANADVIDFYRYETDGLTYRYGDAEREFEVDEQEIVVADGENVTVEARRSVHGPVIDRAEQTVGVAWTGHTATETALAMYKLSRARSVEEALAALDHFESPTQNFVYADRDGETFYRMVGRVPLRTTDGREVPGDQVFDGSEREGEWAGFEPFARSSWEGFVPIEENPHVRNPDVLATANQEIVEDPGYYLAESYADPYRAERIYGLLDERLEAGDPIDLEFLRTLGRDTFDGRAAALVEPLTGALREADDDRLTAAGDRLDAWDFHMDADSRAALVFDRWMAHYREALLAEPFAEAGLDASYFPTDGAIERLSPESEWFEPDGRAAVMRRAMRAALAEIAEREYDTYGDISHTGVIEHPLGLAFLQYPEIARGGSGETVWNFNAAGPWGGGWEMQVDFDGELLGMLAGGNSGRYFSPHYADQIERWARGEYRSLSREIEGELHTTFEEGTR